MTRQSKKEYAGLARENEVFSNGGPIAGTIYSMLPKEARNAIDRADVILAKGQGNYESVSGQANGFPKKQVFYAFLCKCELFTKRFNVAPLTGVLTREGYKESVLCISYRTERSVAVFMNVLTAAAVFWMYASCPG